MSLIFEERRASSALGCLLSGVLLSAGIMLCLFNWAEGPECSQRGCSLYSEATIFGASLFAWGTGVFVVLIFALPTRYFRLFALLAVAADVPLLAWQAIFGPCGKCLLVAGLLLINAHVAGWSAFSVRKSTPIALRIAAVLLCLNIGILTAEAIRPWLTEQIRATPTLEGLRRFLPPVQNLQWQSANFGSMFH